MLSIRSSACAVLALSLGMASVSYAAADQGPYISASVGVTHSNLDLTDAPEKDASDKGFRLAAGYKINKNFALEAGYTDLGKVKAAGTENGEYISAQIKFTNIFELSAVATIPMMDKLNGYARLGVYNGKAKVSATSTNLITQAVQSASETKRSTNAVYGIGVDYALNAQTSIRGEITNYARIKVPGDDKNDVALFSVGVAYKF